MSLVLNLAMLGFPIATVVLDYQATGNTAKAMTLTLAVADLVHELQRERGLTAGLLGGEARYRADVIAQRGRSDAALATLEQVIGNDGSLALTAVRAALDRVHALATTRAEVDLNQAPRDTTFQNYTDIIAGLLRLDPGFDHAADPTLRRAVQALQVLGNAKESAGQERGFMNGVFAAGRFEADEYLQFLQVRADKLSSLAEFARYATPDQRARLDTALRSPEVAPALADEATAMNAVDGKLPTRVEPSSWWASMTHLVDDMRTVQRSIGDDIRARTAEVRSTARRLILVVGLLALLAVAAEIALAGGAVRSIIRPLAMLVSEADDVATRRLPAAVARAHAATGDEPLAPPDPVRAPARASTEIAAVASALDRVQRTAVELATEQAVLRRNTTESLANLGRRNQNLVRRQLGFISQLEHEELDPSALANLFKLDHLATRMRRNAESLLALVGQSSPRRWSEPVPMTDVIRAALSEVEDYRRVVLRRIDDAHVTGAVVAELAHMLAELIENGLSFSPPDIEVEIYGRRMGARYLLAVIDHGVGMRPNMMAQANTRLRGKDDFLVAPTRFLGHFVVGRLAQRLSVDVQLTDSPVVGITARMMLPADILVEPAAAAPADVGSPAQPAPQEAPSVAGAQPPSPVPATSEDGAVDPGEPAADALGVPSQVRPGPPAPAEGQRTAAAAPGALPQPPPAKPGPERTRNGLVKRVPRKSMPAPPSTPDPQRDAVDKRTVDERSPGDVRAMLATFRAAHRRGESGLSIEAPNPLTAAHTGQTPPPREEDPSEH